jgi:hypothetical protein
MEEQEAEMKKGYIEILNGLFKGRKYGFIHSPLPIPLISLTVVNPFPETLNFVIPVSNYHIGNTRKNLKLFLGFVAYSQELPRYTNTHYRLKKDINKILGEKKCYEPIKYI